MDELWGGPDPLDPPPYLRHCKGLLDEPNRLVYQIESLKDRLIVKNAKIYDIITIKMDGLTTVLKNYVNCKDFFTKKMNEVECNFLPNCQNLNRKIIARYCNGLNRFHKLRIFIFKIISTKSFKYRSFATDMLVSCKFY
jgi:hypothetical protein